MKTSTRLPACPSTPNCVSTDATDQGHAIPPFVLARAEAWPEIRTAVLAMPRTRLVAESEHFLQVECRSRVFRFVDDLTLELRPDENLLAVRSASRLGSYDFGANRGRLEKLRAILQARGLIRGTREAS